MVNLTQKSERVAQALLAVATIGFLLSALVYLYGGRWTVTLQDYWIIYDTCLNHSWLESALRKVNHQPVFFPSLIWLADLRFAHGNQELLFFVGMVLLSGTAIVLLMPFWRDTTLSVTTKLEASLVVIVANFWMGRAAITTSGGFNCICSLAMGGAVMAFLCLSKTQNGSERLLKWCFPVIGFAFLASFSFGTGLAIWPTLLVLGWSLRLSWWSLGVIFVGGLLAGIIYFLLPGQSVAGAAPGMTGFSLPIIGTMLHRLCMLIGAPFLFSQAAWSSAKISKDLAASSLFCVICGWGGLVWASLVVAPRVLRQDIARRPSQIVAIGLVLFNLFVMVIIVLGRIEHVRSYPSEVVAPRYLFWSALFWAGLMLTFILSVSTTKWLHWLILVLTVAVPVVVFPFHYKEGLHWRHAQYLAECAATSLINDVRDEKQITILFRDPKQVYRLASKLRTERLDMFAAGYQDLIGQREIALFGGRRDSEGFEGKFEVKELVKDADDKTAAKVTGWSLKREGMTPTVVVLIDSEGVICGVARSWKTDALMSRVFYGGAFSASASLAISAIMIRSNGILLAVSTTRCCPMSTLSCKARKGALLSRGAAVAIPVSARPKETGTCVPQGLL